MKYHKIRNVPLDVCTAESKIAYNAAFLHAADYRETWRKTKDKYAGWARSEFIHEAVNWCMKFVMRDENIMKRYDVDAIQCCLNAGMENYFNHEHIFLNSYEEIGNIFKSLYL